jgi:hypothetical protein
MMLDRQPNIMQLENHQAFHRTPSQKWTASRRECRAMKVILAASEGRYPSIDHSIGHVSRVHESKPIVDAEFTSPREGERSSTLGDQMM